MATNPFIIDVYDKARDWVGRLADPVAIDGSVKYNALGNFQIRIRADDPMAGDILTKGARCVIRYRGEHLYSGLVRTPQGSILAGSDIVFQLKDDWRILENTVAWIRPSGDIAPTSLQSTLASSFGQATLPGGGADAGPNGTTQGQFGYYLWPDGSAAAGFVNVRYAETAVKTILTANLINRLGLPVVMAPDLERGGDALDAGVLPLIRMSKLSEAIQPILDWSGLRVQVVQRWDQHEISVDVIEPSVWQAPLTVDSEVLTDGTWTRNDPKATRSIVGGPGEDVNRAFWEVRDTTGLEDEYGDIIEVFRDATSGNLKWPSSLTDPYKVAKYFLLRSDVSALDQTTFRNYLIAAGTKGLAEGAPSSSVQATLSETESFYFGGAEGIQLGDRVTIKAANAELFSDRITEAKFSLTKDKFTVEPILGTKTDDRDRQLADAIASVAAAQRRLSASR